MWYIVYVLPVMKASGSDREKPTPTRKATPPEDDEDPGLLFVLFPPTRVHAALALPSVANVRPALQQGKNYCEISDNKSNGVFVLPGANEEQSIINLYKWLDDVAMQLGLQHSLAVAFNGNRIPGLYHHLSVVEEQQFRSRIGFLCQQWHGDCIQHNASAGYVVELSGSTGTAKGMLSVVSVGLGPFMCLR